MKKLLLSLAACLALSAHGKCLTNDRWTGPDKVLHFGAGAGVASATMLATGSKRDAIMAAAIAGALKEALDRGRAGHTCSLQDFAVTALGGVAGAYVTGLVIGPGYVGYFKRF